MSIGVGVIGWGAIAAQLHGPCLSGIEECNLIAVCDQRRNGLHRRGGTGLQAYGCEGYGEIDAFLDRPDL